MRKILDFKVNKDEEFKIIPVGKETMDTDFRKLFKITQPRMTVNR